MTHAVSTKPYLIRAIYEWAIDHGLTPQLLVATEHENVVVPLQHVRDNKIVLNIHPQSVKHLELGDEYLLFSARFSGKVIQVSVPVVSVQAIYARENGQGIVFNGDDNFEPPEPEGKTEKRDKRVKTAPLPATSAIETSHLKLVK